MIESSAAYLAAITGDTRRVLLKAVINIIDPDMRLTGGSADSLAPWAKTAELYDYRLTTARSISRPTSSRVWPRTSPWRS